MYSLSFVSWIGRISDIVSAFAELLTLFSEEMGKGLDHALCFFAVVIVAPQLAQEAKEVFLMSYILSSLFSPFAEAHRL